MTSLGRTDSCAPAAPFLITFSGIDGAGKTTQINYLATELKEQGLRVLRLGFWDHVAVWPRVRAGVGHRAWDAHHATAEPTFVPKNHKHARRWYLTGARVFLYLLDVARLRELITWPAIKSFDVVIFDRYIYDQIANIDSRSFVARIYRRILLKLTPSPDLAFLLDTAPDAAFARKPEYPVESMRNNRRNFLRLRELVPELVTIADAELEDVRGEIHFHVCRSNLLSRASHRGSAEVVAEGAVARL